jgi:uncharacterized repeat protein (TIGR03803 family)
MLKARMGWAFVLLLLLAASLEAQYSVLHNFSGTTTDGKCPNGSFVLKGSVLYGMTLYGGASGAGTIFKINMGGTGFAVIHSFAGGTTDGKNPYGSLTLVNGKLYGMTNQGGTVDGGILFKINSDGTGFELLHSFVASLGTYPYGSLIRKVSGKIGDMLYGMTSRGGHRTWASSLSSYKLK